MPSVEVTPTWWPTPRRIWLIMRTVVVLPLEPVTATIGMREGDPGQHLLVAEPAARMPVDDLDQLPDGVLAVAHDLGRDALRYRHHVAAHDQDAVIVSPDEALDHDHAAASLLDRPLEALADRGLVRKLQADTAPVIAVQRLGHDRETDPVSGGHGVVLGAHRLAAGDRQAGRGEQRGGQLL